MLSWELNLVEDVIEDKEIEAGFTAQIPEAYDESRNGWITNFYFAEHEGSENNHISILDRCGDELFVKITGEIIDVNYYDGSKPNSKIAVRTWFKVDENTMRSMN